MAGIACQGKDGRARNKNGPLHHHALQQSALHDALLHSAVRICSESSLHPAAYLLHRPSDLRPAHPHLFLHRYHHHRSHHDGNESHHPRNVRRLGHRDSLDHVCPANLSVDPLRLPPGLVHQHAQILHRRFYLYDCAVPRPGGNILHHSCHPNMIKKILSQILFVLLGATVALGGPQMIAFERKDAVWIGNLDGTGEKKLADGIFPAISPDGTRIAFNTVEKTSETSYVRHMAVVDVATGKVNLFKDIPSENSYYP